MIKMLLIWLAAMTVIADLSSEQATLDRPRVFCGRALAEARLLYCIATDDDQSSEVLQKRSTQTTQTPTDFKVWWLSRHVAYIMSGHDKRNGLVDECCLKPCYRSELLSYC